MDHKLIEHQKELAAAGTLLDGVLSIRNPFAPPYEPKVWSTGSINEIDAVARRFSDVIRAMQENGLAISTDSLIRNILRKSAADIAEKLEFPSSTISALQRQLTPVFSTVTFCTNCYDYAANHKRKNAPGAKGIAGAIKGTQKDNNTFRAFVQGAIGDGFKLFDPAEGLAKGRYLCLAFLDPTFKNDTHFVRQDNNGFFSQKSGHHPPTNLDSSGGAIANPLDANLGIYNRFIAAFTAPSGGIETRDPEF